ncbi:MAG: DNA-deoxyinosine glycosylase [Spirochaetaceae bacterium]|nr:DNA-deoxyinosine glycosylase [Spirochaetaceae bacterium]
MGRARLLVLGSFPSIRSMEKGEYYGHQRNHFWPLLALVAGLPEAPSTYDARSALAASLGLLIWDMVATCSRRTSSDNDLIIHQLNDIQGLLAANPSLIRIGLNGGLAATLFLRQFAGGSMQGRSHAPYSALEAGQALASAGGRAMLHFGSRHLEVLRLPSTSPVPSSRFRTLEDKLPLWKEFLCR